MRHLAKYIVALLLGAGVLLGSASLVDAHSPLLSYYYWRHDQQTQTANLCAYECALKNHDVWDWDECQGGGHGDCKCKD